nr:hypothetical protein [Mucilaginibacter sp. X5P1]
MKIIGFFYKDTADMLPQLYADGTGQGKGVYG